MVGAEGVTDAYECMARGSVDEVKVNVSANGFGEKRIIELDVNYRIYLNCVCKDKVTVTEDIYAEGCDVKTESEKREFCFLAKNTSKNFTVNTALMRETLELDGAEAVFEVSSDPRVTGVKLSEDGYKLTVSGIAPTSAIVKKSDGLYSVEYTVPFTAELDGEGIPKEYTYNADTVCTSARGRLDNEKLYTDLEIQLSLMVLGVNSVSVLKSAELSQKPCDEERPQMRFFYPAPSETLWDVGKRFGVSQKKLCEVNKISGGKAPEMLIIPVK